MARRVLLADDSVTAQNMGRRILTDAGYEVVTVNNGSAALKKIAENKPDIIVLDVYMPGYGGLEVCQRVKEAAETARIPVLLTVGKLEPFRPEEARRVNADAFIVKPFEATELLTALTKLEDKIVAAPQPQKSGRFAKALAAVEGADFGDKETGWKNRLTIPGPNAKARPAEAEAPPEVVAGSSRDFARSESGQPADLKQEFERPIPAGLPADITSEEIAAITAAAASFDGKAGHPTVIAEGSASDSAAAMQAASAETTAVDPSEPAATLASATELEQAPPAEVAAEPAPVAAEAVAEAVAGNEAATKAEEVPAATELQAAVAETDATPQAASVAHVTEDEKPSSRDAEVMAAIASLAPSNGQGSESAAPASGANGTFQEVTAGTASVAAAEAAITGPRWIAESVAVAVEESAATLDQEMERASAARDLAPAAAVELAAPVPAVETAEPVIAEAGTVAEPVSVTEPVAAAEPVPASMAAETSSVESPAVQEIAQAVAQEPEPAPAKEESAYAAAAAAGSASEPVSQVEAISSPTVAPEISENVPVASVEVAPQHEAELAAAWQNWKQIRESFVSTPASAPVAEAPAAETSAPQSVSQEDASALAPVAEDVAEPDPETSEVEASAAETPGESTAIASIVDTMLAELRPKLVEEIARKMSSEKKDKEKEKDKKKKK